MLTCVRSALAVLAYQTTTSLSSSLCLSLSPFLSSCVLCSVFLRCKHHFHAIFTLVFQKTLRIKPAHNPACPCDTSAMFAAACTARPHHALLACSSGFPISFNLLLSPAVPLRHFTPGNPLPTVRHPRPTWPAHSCKFSTRPTAQSHSPLPQPHPTSQSSNKKRSPKAPIHHHHFITFSCHPTPPPPHAPSLYATTILWSCATVAVRKSPTRRVSTSTGTNLNSSHTALHGCGNPLVVCGISARFGSFTLHFDCEEAEVGTTRYSPSSSGSLSLGAITTA